MLWVMLFLSLLLQQKPAARPEPQEKPAKPDAVSADPTRPPTEAETKPGSAQKPPSFFFNATATTETETTAEPVVYTLDPEKAAKEVQVGSFHMKRHNWNAAEARFAEAVKWDPKLAEAWLRLGEAREKTGQSAKALEAYRKYLELDANGKKARDVKKTVARLERELK